MKIKSSETLISEHTNSIGLGLFFKKFACVSQAQRLDMVILLCLIKIQTMMVTKEIQNELSRFQSNRDSK